MKCFYKAIIKYLKKMLSLGDTLLQALTCLNPREQNSVNGLQYCRKVAEAMPSIRCEEQIIVGDEWVRYTEINVDDDDMEVRVDHFWDKMFRRTDESGDRFEILPKMVKCALALCHSNADVERSLSVNKRTLTKQNMAMKDETLIGLRVIKDAIKHAGGITKVEVSLNMIKAAEKSRSLYHEHLKEEKKTNEEKKNERDGAKKRKIEEKATEEKKLHVKLQEYREREKAQQDKMKKGMKHVNDGHEKANAGIKASDMMEIEEGQTMATLGAKWQKEALEEIDRINCEKNKIENELFKLTSVKKPKV